MFVLKAHFQTNQVFFLKVFGFSEMKNGWFILRYSKGGSLF